MASRLQVSTICVAIPLDYIKGYNVSVLILQRNTTGWHNFMFDIFSGGVLNHSAEIIYKETNDRVSIVQKFLGLDVFDQLKLELQITGKVPLDVWDRLTINDYQTQFNFISPGE